MLLNQHRVLEDGEDEWEEIEAVVPDTHPEMTLDDLISWYGAAERADAYVTQINLRD